MSGAHRSLRVLDPLKDPAEIERDYGADAAKVWQIVRDAQRVEEEGGWAVAEVQEVEAPTPAGPLRAAAVRTPSESWLGQDPVALDRLKRLFPAEPEALEAAAAAEAVEVVEVWVEEDPGGLTPVELLRRMAEKGYGRPSTYAGHVTAMGDWFHEEGGRMRLDPWGRERARDLEALPVVVDAAFTARLEAELEGVERGELRAEEVLARYVGLLFGVECPVPEPLADPVDPAGSSGPRPRTGTE